MRQAVFCFALSEVQAELILNQLRNSGYLPEAVPGPHVSEVATALPPVQPHEATLRSGAATGARMGAVLGSAFGLGLSVGWLVGIGELAAPDLALWVAGSPVLSVLGASLGGAMLGIAASGLLRLGLKTGQSKLSSSARSTF